MERDTFTIKQHDLTKALLSGHLINILLGLLTFSVCHWLFKLSLTPSIIATIIATAGMSIVVSILGTRRLRAPLSALNQELTQLHERVTTSTSALSTAHESTQALLEDLPLGFLVFNQRDELTKINQAAVKILGLPSEPLPTAKTVLSSLSDLKSGNQPLNFVDWLHESKTQAISALKRWPMVVIPQAETDIVCDILVHYNKHDSHNYELVVMLVDRTEEYDHQEKQMEFISLAAHELRGPITVMRGLIDILQDEVGKSLSQEHQELLTRMAISARQLAGYVDNILNVSRVERDGFAIQPREADWGTVLTQATSDLAIRAKAHHRQLELRLPKNLPTVAVDPIAIQHVIQNLIDNAIKYSKDGGKIIISVHQKDGMVETTIEDFGIGIPGNVVSNLFTKFYRSHRSKQIVSGTGLGLYLCKTIVDTHGGNIWVRSTEGVGTTFGFSLPTYASVADKLKSGDNEESGIVRGSHGWIKNHALYRR